MHVIIAVNYFMMQWRSLLAVQTRRREKRGDPLNSFRPSGSFTYHSLNCLSLELKEQESLPKQLMPIPTYPICLLA